jgi:hypothetical protein
MANSLLLVPERKGNVHAAVGVGNTSNAVLSPSESSRASHVVGEMTPGVSIVTVLCQYKKLRASVWWSILRVVLTDSGPLPLRNVGAPFLPVLGAVIVLLEPALLDAGNIVLVNDNHGEGLAASGVV